jgi:hypothetical protein
MRQYDDFEVTSGDVVVTGRIYRDEHAEDPRKDRDHAGKMVCWHPRAYLGDEQPGECPEVWLENLAMSQDPDLHDRLWALREEDNGGGVTCDEAEEHQWREINKVLDEGVVLLPLFLYDHGGMSMRASPFSCLWDSGQVGFIYMTLRDARENWTSCKGWEDTAYMKGDSPVTLREAARERLLAEVEEYDQYLTGEVYGFIVDEDGEHEDSCWGLYGLEYCKEAGKEAAEWVLKTKVEEAITAAEREALEVEVEVEARQLEASRPDLYPADPPDKLLAGWGSV